MGLEKIYNQKAKLWRSTHKKSPNRSGWCGYVHMDHHQCRSILTNCNKSSVWEPTEVDLFLFYHVFLKFCSTYHNLFLFLSSVLKINHEKKKMMWKSDEKKVQPWVIYQNPKQTKYYKALYLLRNGGLFLHISMFFLLTFYILEYFCITHCLTISLIERTLIHMHIWRFHNFYC